MNSPLPRSNGHDVKAMHLSTPAQRVQEKELRQRRQAAFISLPMQGLEETLSPIVIKGQSAYCTRSVFGKRKSHCGVAGPPKSVGYQMHKRCDFISSIFLACRPCDSQRKATLGMPYPIGPMYWLPTHPPPIKIIKVFCTLSIKTGAK